VENNENIYHQYKRSVKEKVKTNLVNVCSRTNQIQFPIWQSVLCNTLRLHKLDVNVIDTIPIDLDKREEWFKSQLSDEPEIYGFSIMAGNNQIIDVDKYAKIIKQHNKKNIVIFGGPLPSACPELIMKNCSCDYIICGEGETSLPQLIYDLINYQNNNSNTDKPEEIVRSDIKIRPLDKYSELDLNNIKTDFDMNFYIGYLKEANFSWELMASRGCRFNCAFCYKLCGTGMTYRAPDFILDEIQFFKEEFNFHKFYFVDENFFADKEWFDNFIKRKNERGLEFTFRGMSRAETITDELCEVGKKNGLLSISFGIESVSDDTLRKVGKGTSKKLIEETIKRLTKYDLRASMGFVYGFEWETKEDWKATYDFIIKHNIQGFFKLSHLTPLPATRIYDKAIKDGFIKDEFEYIKSLGDLYWTKAVNMTSEPDEVYNYWYKKISDLNTKQVTYPTSYKFLKQIKKIY